TWPTSPGDHGQGIPRTRSTGALDLPRPGADVVDEILSRSFDECCGHVIQFRVAGVKVIAKAEVKSKALPDFPVVLHIRSHFPVPEMAEAGLQMRRCPADNAGIHAGTLTIRSIDGKK